MYTSLQPKANACLSMLTLTSQTFQHILPLEEMHCNNLYNIVYGVNYASQHVVRIDMPRLTGHEWPQNCRLMVSQLQLNTRNAIRDAAGRGDTLAFMALMGTSVHLYQDFYAHRFVASSHTLINQRPYYCSTQQLGRIAIHTRLRLLLGGSDIVLALEGREWKFGCYVGRKCTAQRIYNLCVKPLYLFRVCRAFVCLILRNHCRPMERS